MEKVFSPWQKHVHTCIRADCLTLRRQAKFYYCADRKSGQTTKNWIDRTSLRSEQSKYDRPYTIKIGTIMKMGLPYTVKVGDMLKVILLKRN